MTPDRKNGPMVSVVIGSRNEYPIILSTIMSFVEELESFCYRYEIIVVDNLSTDDTVHVLRDRMRRWIREKRLKVIEYSEKPANVTVRNVGARAAVGDVVVLTDAHVAIKHGTIDGMVRGWEDRGGLWHTTTNIWGDDARTRCYGYDLRMVEKFWGNLSRGVPTELQTKPDSDRRKADTTPIVPYYRVPMASHCCLLAGREQFLDFGGYCEQFKCYGGGEPYLDMLWWLFGSEVWLYADGLVRHAFGLDPKTSKAPKDKKIGSRVMLIPRGDGGPVFTNVLKKDDEYLRYSRGYAWTNDWFQQNFMMSAYTVGGYPWLQQRYATYHESRKGNSRYVADLRQMRKDVLRDGAETRKFIASRQNLTLSELLGHDQHGNPVDHPGSLPWTKHGDLLT